MEWQPGIVFMRHTGGGSSYIESHHCWNRELFIATREAECAKNNADPKRKDKISVTVVSEAVYNAQRFGKRK